MDTSGIHDRAAEAARNRAAGTADGRAAGADAVAARARLGLLLFTVAALFLAVLWLSAAIAPDGLLVDNNLSSLGITGETALLFNAGLVGVGLLDFVAARFLRRNGSGRLMPIVFAVAGAGAIGTGVINVGIEKHVHAVVSAAGFLGHVAMPFALGTRSESGAVRLLSTIAGVASLAFLLTWVVGMIGFTNAFDAFGKGGTQVLVLLPVVVWTLGFGGYLMASRRRAGEGGAVRPARR
jgi:hypothetical membrane protein